MLKDVLKESCKRILIYIWKRVAEKFFQFWMCTVFNDWRSGSSALRCCWTTYIKTKGKDNCTEMRYFVKMQLCNTQRRVLSYRGIINIDKKTRKLLKSIQMSVRFFRQVFAALHRTNRFGKYIFTAVWLITFL